jgi:Pyridoxamine 5'-phosphate oxidase
MTRTPQAAVVGFAVTDEFEFVFDTLKDTRKARNLRHTGHAALVVGTGENGDERTAQIEGLADEPSGEELVRLQHAYYAVFPDGHLRLAWPGLIYIRVTAQWIRYSDFSKDPPQIVEFTAKDLCG